MARLLVQYLAIYRIENLPNSVLAKIGSKLSQELNQKYCERRLKV